MINLKIEKDCWIMATNGVGIFSRFEACAGAEIFWAGEDMFAIAADTEEELLNKVFINPEEGETEYINKESPNYAGQGKLRSKYLAKPKPNLYEQRITGEEDWVENLNEKEKPKRARDASGKFIKDDPSTPDYNEAWEGGKAP